MARTKQSRADAAAAAAPASPPTATPTPTHTQMYTHTLQELYPNLGGVIDHQGNLVAAAVPDAALARWETYIRTYPRETGFGIIIPFSRRADKVARVVKYFSDPNPAVYLLPLQNACNRCVHMSWFCFRKSPAGPCLTCRNEKDCRAQHEGVEVRMLQPAQARMLESKGFVLPPLPVRDCATVAPLSKASAAGPSVAAAAPGAAAAPPTTSRTAGKAASKTSNTKRRREAAVVDGDEEEYRPTPKRRTPLPTPKRATSPLSSAPPSDNETGAAGPSRTSYTPAAEDSLTSSRSTSRLVTPGQELAQAGVATPGGIAPAPEPARAPGVLTPAQERALANIAAREPLFQSDGLEGEGEDELDDDVEMLQEEEVKAEVGDDGLQWAAPSRVPSPDRRPHVPHVPHYGPPMPAYPSLQVNPAPPDWREYEQHAYPYPAQAETPGWENTAHETGSYGRDEDYARYDDRYDTRTDDRYHRGEGPSQPPSRPPQPHAGPSQYAYRATHPDSDSDDDTPQYGLRAPRRYYDNDEDTSQPHAGPSQPHAGPSQHDHRAPAHRQHYGDEIGRYPPVAQHHRLAHLSTSGRSFSAPNPLPHGQNARPAPAVEGRWRTRSPASDATPSPPHTRRSSRLSSVEDALDRHTDTVSPSPPPEIQDTPAIDTPPVRPAPKTTTAPKKPEPAAPAKARQLRSRATRRGATIPASPSPPPLPLPPVKSLPPPRAPKPPRRASFNQLAPQPAYATATALAKSALKEVKAAKSPWLQARAYTWHSSGTERKLLVNICALLPASLHEPFVEGVRNAWTFRDNYRPPAGMRALVADWEDGGGVPCLEEFFFRGLSAEEKAALGAVPHMCWEPGAMVDLALRCMPKDRRLLLLRAVDITVNETRAV